jgi:serine/threonine-protein kinase RsbW
VTQPNSNSASARTLLSSLSGATLFFTQVLPSDIHLVETIVERVMGILGKQGCRERQCVAAELSLREALANAILHGNGSDHQKRVELSCYRHSDGSVTLVVRDEGPGFSLEGLPDPTAPENVYRDGGRGIYLIRHFMDEVEFDRGGAEIRMRKKQESSEEDSPSKNGQ